MGLEVLTGERQQHSYRACQDEDCQRYACRIYREGYADGNAAGCAAGEAAGYGQGHADGYSAGAANSGDG